MLEQGSGRGKFTADRPLALTAAMDNVECVLIFVSTPVRFGIKRIGQK